MDIQNILNKAIKELKEDQALPPENTKLLQGTATTPQEIWSGMKETGSNLVDKLQAGAEGFKDFIQGSDSAQSVVDKMGANLQQIYNQNIAPTVEKGAGYFKDLGSSLKAFGQEQLDKVQDYADKTFPNGLGKITIGGKDVTPIVGSPMTKFSNRAGQDWHNSEGILDFIKNRPDLAAGAGIPAALLAGAGALALRRRQRAAQNK